MAGFLIECGGLTPGRCLRQAHVTCAQRMGMGWHLKLHAGEYQTGVEVLCERCDDAFLDMSGTKLKYKLHGEAERQAAERMAYASDEACANAPFLFQDWCHGYNGGMRRAAERLGGVCTGACDSDEAARMAYLATFQNEHASLHNLSVMGTDLRVLRQSHVLFCGFCCKPFSPAGEVEGFAHVKYGDNFGLLVAALAARRERGIFDPCLIIENVPNLLSFLTPEQLESLGYKCRLYVVSGSLFRCANVRQRLVIIGFLDEEHLSAFSPPPPQCTAPTPLRTVLKRFTPEEGRGLFEKPTALAKAKARCHVVGRGFPFGAHSPTSH